MVTKITKVAIDHMLPRQEWQQGRPAQCQPLQRHFRAPVVRRVVQTSCEDVGRILLAVGGNIHFRKIQVKLCLPAIHPHCGVAEFFRLRPSLLRRRHRDTHIRNVKGIGWLVIEGGPQMRQSSNRVTPAQECEAGPELLKCLQMYHGGILRKEIESPKVSRVCRDLRRSEEHTSELQSLAY